MTARRIFLCAALTALLGAGQAWAQSAGTLVARGVAAYRALEYDSAATLFRRGLAVSGADALSGSARTDALGYLGASEALGGDASAAAAAFVQALALNPRYRIDDLVFPPLVSRAFDNARLTTAYTTVRASSDTVIVAGTRGLELRLFSSAPHNVVVTIVPNRGIVRQIYAGPIGDSLTLNWNGIDSTDYAPVSGAFTLTVQSRSANMRGETTLPLTVNMMRVDTLVPPARPATRTVSAVRTGGISPTRALAFGTIAGAAAILLPTLISDADGDAMPERFVVGGTLGAAGIFGFFKGRSEMASNRENAANTRALENWQRAYANVQSENERRKRARQLHIITGSVTIRTASGS